MSPEETNTNPSPNTPVATSPPPAKKRQRTVLIIIILLFVGLPLLAYALLVISLSGGIDTILINMRRAPKPESSSVVAQRNTAKASIANSFAALDGNIGLTSYGTSTHDTCYQGQNNYKVKDGYAYRCSYRTTKFYGFSSNFRSEMLDFEQTIYNLGWKPQEWQHGHPPMKEVIEDYYDEYYGPGKASTLNRSYPYLVSDLPSPSGGYLKNTGKLEIKYAEKATNELNLDQIEYAQQVSSTGFNDAYDKRTFQDIKSVFDKITRDNTYVLVISIQENYYDR